MKSWAGPSRTEGPGFIHPSAIYRKKPGAGIGPWANRNTVIQPGAFCPTLYCACFFIFGFILVLLSFTWFYPAVLVTAGDVGASPKISRIRACFSPSLSSLERIMSRTAEFFIQRWKWVTTSSSVFSRCRSIRSCSIFKRAPLWSSWLQRRQFPGDRLCLFVSLSFCSATDFVFG